MEQEVLLKIENVVKTYPGVQALKGITTTIKKGEVRALVGENGAGKSTLIKCIMGVESPTEGKVEINVDGTWKSPKNAIEAKDYGMHANYQNVNIAKNLSIAENYFLGRVPLKGKFVDWNTMYTESQKVIDKFQLNVNPRDTIVSLPVAMQAMITISKISVNDNIRLVIFDEPTALLENDKVETLFKYIRELKESGVSVIYVSHRLEEIMEICDSVTIMKDGSYVETKDIKEVDKDYLISKMVGRSMVDIYNIERQKPGKELLRVEHLSGDKFTDVSFTLREGEILGFFGLVGAGRSEVMRAIFGVDKIHSGKIFVKGEEVSINSPKQAILKGIGFLTEDRRKDGLALQQSVKLNTNMYSYDMISKNGIINLKKETDRAEEYRKKVAVKTPSVNQIVNNLSGGNQQKVVIAKLLCRNPDILIFDEPTVGVDVGAKDEIFKIIEKLTAQGKGVIIVSSYLPEAMGLSDRMIVMSEGHVAGSLDSQELRSLQEEDVLRLASTVNFD
ncbi:Ribose import ATP-binding protein RbsA [uncultured Clostridium sp.]|uniref:Sugar ABC transporter ATP-binding protein n=2 Tax=Lachnospiraceae TaxID=186803 RepID=A0ABT2SJF7_9FIRM|nr:MULTISPECIES: sugar ABC transporter ATP-binding protein [Lachnospiraceae]MBC8572629.1 sugar ABC transporter ATP-binding protein [Jingyaoa shaoxingensis]MCU6724642.1 sugar ABC transporter ATP-binding protein [Muricoprocola aceti]SCH20805.1 Ribose import ATP-binding protein RbsA [uncultured Clostridium sp.]